jgi:hypothetical protein
VSFFISSSLLCDGQQTIPTGSVNVIRLLMDLRHHHFGMGGHQADVVQHRGHAEGPGGDNYTETGKHGGHNSRVGGDRNRRQSIPPSCSSLSILNF